MASKLNAQNCADYKMTAYQSNVSAIQDTRIKVHAEKIAVALNGIDNAKIVIAYHMYAMGMSGNTLVEFCKKNFGIGKAQCYNYLVVGEYISCVTYNGKSIYIDSFTEQLILDSMPKDENGSILDWNEYFKKLKKAKSFGMTAVLNLVYALTKTTAEKADIMELIDKGTISPDMSIKRLTEILFGKYKPAIEQKTEDEKTEDEKTEDEKTEDEKTEDNKNKVHNDNMVNIPETLVKNAYPEFARYAEESPAIAKLLEYLEDNNIIA